VPFFTTVHYRGKVRKAVVGQMTTTTTTTTGTLAVTGGGVLREGMDHDWF